jgi:hypothetical protein
MPRLFHSSSEGTSEISRPQRGWCFAPRNNQVPQGRRIFSAVPSGRIFLRTVFQPLCGWLISGCRSATQLSVAAIILFFALGAMAQTTNGLSDAEIQGRKLAQQLCDARPAENFTNTGVLQVRVGSGKRLESSLVVKTMANSNSWEILYSATLAVDKDLSEYALSTTHTPGQQNIYRSTEENFAGHFEKDLLGNKTMTPFAGSDFWICDLGLEFFHWPGQKILKKENTRGRGCMVLESTNPEPPTNGYSRVVSWIDEESGGIVQARAYDFNGKLLKEFDLKSFKKDASGQWQLQEMEIYNDQTRSRTQIKFDVKKQ